jgi:hypothetical protein
MSGYYNDFSHAHAAVDLQAVHRLSRSKQVSWTLHYVEASDLWYFEISSSAPSENTITKDHSLSITLALALGHLEKL